MGKRQTTTRMVAMSKAALKRKQHKGRRKVGSKKRRNRRRVRLGLKVRRRRK